MNWMHQHPEPSPGYGGRRAQLDDFLDAGRGHQVAAPLSGTDPAGIRAGRRQRAPPVHRDNALMDRADGGSTGPDRQARRPRLATEGIRRAIKTVYSQARRFGNLRPAGISPGVPEARAVIGIFALGCFVTGFTVAWVLRTGYVMTQISWTSKQLEHKVRYWQSEALYARNVAVDALRQLAAITGEAPAPPDWPGPGHDGQRPASD